MVAILEEPEVIMRLADESMKQEAFEYYWTKLQATLADQVDLNALRFCVQLLPPIQADGRVSLGHCLG